MKFAKELDQELVPEWRIKYLNYKAGKKYIKAVSRAISRASNATPHRTGELPPRLATPSFLGVRWAGNQQPDVAEEIDHLSLSPAPMGRGKSYPRRASRTAPKSVTPGGERQSLAKSPGASAQYGSFVGSPPARSEGVSSESRDIFELPAPAMRVPSSTGGSPQLPPMPVQRSLNHFNFQRSASLTSGVPTAQTWAEPSSSASGTTPRQRIRRMLSSASPTPRATSRDFALEMFDEVREREREFFRFMDNELDKVETFYKQKEDQAGQRLIVLRDQLHEMRNRRTEEIYEARRKKEEEGSNGVKGTGLGISHHGQSDNQSWMDPIRAKLFKPGPNSNALQKMAYTPEIAHQKNGNRDYVRHQPRDDAVSYRTAKRKLKLALQEFYRGLELLKSYALLNRTAFRKLNKKYDKAVNVRPPYRFMNEKVNKSWFVNSDILDAHIQAVEDLYARYFERGNRKIAAGKLRSLNHRPRDESASAFRNGLLVGIGMVFAVQGLVYGAELLYDPDPTLSLQTSYLLQLYGGYFLMLYIFAFFCVDCSIWTLNKINYPFIFEFDARSQLDWRQLAEFPSFFILLFGLFMWINFSRFGSPTMYIYYPVILIGLTFVILFCPFPILFYRSRRWFLYSHFRMFLAGLYPVEFRDFFLGDMYCSLTYATANIELFFCLYAQAWGNPVQCNSNHSRLMGFFCTLPGIWRALQCIRRYKDTRNVFPHLVNCGKYSMTIMSYLCLSLYRIQQSDSNLALFITFSAINSIYCSVWDVFMDFSLLQPDSRHFLLRDVIALKRRWPYYVIMVLDPILRFAWVFYAIFTHDAQHSTIVSFLASFAEVTRRGLWTIFRVENEHCANVAQYKASRDVPLPYHLTEPLMERPSLEAEAEAEAEAAKTPKTGGVLTSPQSTTAVSSNWKSTPGAEQPPTPASAPGRAGTDKAVSVGTPATSGARAEEVEEGRATGRASRKEEEAGGGIGGVSPTLRRRQTQGEAVASSGRSIMRIMAEAHKQDFEKKKRPGADDDVSAASVAGRGGPGSSNDEDEDDDSDEEMYRGGAAGYDPDAADPDVDGGYQDYVEGVRLSRAAADPEEQP